MSLRAECARGVSKCGGKTDTWALARTGGRRPCRWRQPARTSCTRRRPCSPSPARTSAPAPARPRRPPASVRRWSSPLSPAAPPQPSTHHPPVGEPPSHCGSAAPSPSRSRPPQRAIGCWCVSGLPHARPVSPPPPPGCWRWEREQERQWEAAADEAAATGPHPSDRVRRPAAPCRAAASLNQCPASTPSPSRRQRGACCRGAQSRQRSACFLPAEQHAPQQRAQKLSCVPPPRSPYGCASTPETPDRALLLALEPRRAAR